MQEVVRRRDNKSTLPYYCSCNEQERRYSSYQSLHTHIKQKHGNGAEFVAHLQQLNKQIVRQKNERAKKLQKFTLKNIKINRHDQTKLRLITNTIQAIYKAYGPTIHKDLLLDPAQSNEEDYYEEDSREERCRNDEIVELEEKNLIQKYELWDLFGGHLGNFAEFGYEATPDEEGKQGKFILLKKDLAQHFSMKWAPKFHFQLDICAAIQRKTPEAELKEKVQRCQGKLWGKYGKIGAIVKQYYEAVLSVRVK